MPSEYGERTINLLGQDNVCKLVRQRNLAQRKEHLRPLSSSLRPAIRRANGKHNPLLALVAQLRQYVRKRFGGMQLTAGIEQYAVSARSSLASFRPREKRLFVPEDHLFSRTIPGRAFRIIRRQIARGG